MPVDIDLLEEDIDVLEMDDINNLEVSAMGDLFIKYADSNSPQSIEEVFDEPVTEGVVHAYIGFYVGYEMPIPEVIPTAFSWCVRDLTAIQNELARLDTDKQNKLSDPQMAAVNSGITETKVAQYTDHLDNVSNPHRVNKTQVGLGNVENTGDSAAPALGGLEKFTTGGAYALQSALLTRISEINQLLNDAIINERNARVQRDNELTTLVNGKQDQLVNKINIKSINNQSILGSGNLIVQVDPSQPIKDFTYDGVHTLEQVMETKANRSELAECVGYEEINDEEEE